MKEGVLYFFTSNLKLLIESQIQKIHPSDRDRFLSDIARNIDYYKKEILKVPTGPMRARVVYKAIDDLIARSKAAPGGKEYWAQVSCKSGCSACCHTHVLVSKDEGELLARHITSGAVKVDMGLLEEQAKFEGDELAWWRQPKEKNRCVFLGEDNRCRIYQDRPASCRKYFVATPPEQCANVGADAEREVAVLAEFDQELVATAAADIDRNTDNLPKTVWKILQQKKYPEQK